MLDEFIDFTQSLFPSISPYVKERTKASIKQFELNGKKLNLFNYRAYDYLTQGDIFDGIPFTRLEEDGNISMYRGKGMLISNTCSADHDDEILNRMIEQGKIAKETSLNQFGFYLFLCKLTVCFMRPEDEEVQADRRENYMQLHCAN